MKEYSLIKKLWYRVICFGKFLKYMVKYPTTPIENWEDMNSIYMFSTDVKCREMLKELEDL